MWLEAMLYVEKTKKFHSWDFIWFLFCELARDCVQGCVFKNLRKIKMLFLLFLVGLGCVVPVSIVDWWNVKEKLWSILSMWVLLRLCGFLLIFLGFSLVKNVKKVGKWENAVCLSKRMFACCSLFKRNMLSTCCPRWDENFTFRQRDFDTFFSGNF